MIDDDDRQAIGQGVIRLAVIVLVVLTAAATVGLSVRLFQIVSGI